MNRYRIWYITSKNYKDFIAENEKEAEKLFINKYGYKRDIIDVKEIKEYYE